MSVLPDRNDSEIYKNEPSLFSKDQSQGIRNIYPVSEYKVNDYDMSWLSVKVIAEPASLINGDLATCN